MFLIYTTVVGAVSGAWQSLPQATYSKRLPQFIILKKMMGSGIMNVLQCFVLLEPKTQ
jgi:hypothetical protein